MPKYIDSSRELENAFKQIISAGWAMKSDGDVEAPCGYFAKIPISANEMPELLDAVFGDDKPEVTIEPGYYITRENSDGLMWVWNFANQFAMDRAYEVYEAEYEKWGADNADDLA